MGTILLLGVLITQPGSTFCPEMFWFPETALTAPPHYNALGVSGFSYHYNNVVASSDGCVHIVWASIRPDPVRPQIYYKRFIPSAGWIEDTCISADLRSLVGCDNPRIACDSQDNLHVVWEEYYRTAQWNIWYKMRGAIGRWDSISTNIAPGYARKSLPVIACSPNGNVHVAWQEGEGVGPARVMYREKVGNVWGAVCTVVVANRDSLFISSYAIAAGPDNSVHLHWIISTDSAPPTFFYFYRYRNPEGIWSEPESLPFSGSLAINPYTGEPHICGSYDTGLNQPRGIGHLYKSGGVWHFDTITRPIPNVYQEAAHGVFTPDTVLHVVWHVSWYASRIYYTQLWHTIKSPHRQWVSIDVITPDSTKIRHYPSLANGGRSPYAHHLYLVYDVEDTNRIPQVYFVHGEPRSSGVKWEKEASPEPGSNLIVSGARIRYWVEQAGLVRLVVYSVLGRRVRVLAEARKERGWYELVWDGRDETGREMPAGIYYCRFEAAGNWLTGKVILVR
ncbi:MAG: hypothetical protein ACP5JB_06935 [candidate division WOR-3 bacterium]|jgi:hypothetical protein